LDSFTVTNCSVMKFNDYKYNRPSIIDLKADFSKLLKQFRGSKSLEEQNKILQKIQTVRTGFDSMYQLCYIRHTVDTTDRFYEEENNFFDENLPIVQDLVANFYQALVNSPFKKGLKEQWGDQLFTIAELSSKIISPEILDDLQRENLLRSKYTKLKASAKIHFEGAEYNLSSIQPFEIVPERATRKLAGETKWQFYSKNAEMIEGIFDKLVKLRHEIAQKLGYKNFVEVGYARMLRSDYNSEMVANFREQVLKYVVPIASKLRKRQTNRLGLPKLKYYDENFEFDSGNPKPQGPPNWIMDQARTMYSELSPETQEFIYYMFDNDLVDLESKKGKAPGGYCSFIENQKSPFIFSNFNGTSGDIDVLTHEAGHAFQVYSSKQFEIKEYLWPTFEACEIHSMSMEFFTWPWMHLFFKEDTEKYKFAHLSNAISFLPYGVAVDEYQHFVYEHPDATKQERNTAWRAIEEKYLPHRDYDGNTFLEEGGFWQQQRHIFGKPFYYIDYTLALICAFQFWIKNRQDHKQAWEDYLLLCKQGGSQSFLDLVKTANLRSPFEEGVVRDIVAEIESHLNQVDDSKY